MLDDASAAFLKEAAESGLKPLDQMTPAEARALTKGLAEAAGPGPEMARVEDHVLGDDGATYGVRVLVPVDRPQAVIVYYHGGGWVIGSLEEFDTLGRILAERTRSAVVLVDYRLAPEHVYPAAVDDSWAALGWVAEHVGDIAGGPCPLIVAGDSAGGNLAAVMAQRAAAAGGPEVSLQVLVYPVTDGGMDTDSYRDPANQLMLNRGTMVWFWDHYLSDPDARRAPDASPLAAPDLAGLPPAVICTAEHDVLRDEGEEYGRRLAAAGVLVAQRRFAGQIHGFFTMINLLPGSVDGIDYVVDQVNRHLAGEPVG